MDLEPAYRQIFDLFTSKLLNENNWEEIIKQEFFYAWINYIEKENPILKSQPFDEYIKNRNRLAQLLKYQREIAVIKLIYQLNSNIIKPKTFRRNKRTLQNDNLILWNKLSDDLNKKRRILPIRKLIEIYQSIIFKVSPCWLVSPETVSTIFPLKRNLFDLIIFDEASQSAVEKSLPSLYRGGNIVIMGDEKQLRPFDLFKIQDNEDEYEYSDGEEENIINESLLSESLLVLAKRIYGYQYLTWHYRSKYQELIDFSNKAFYDGNLQVAPNILRSMPHPPIQWIYCDSGFWSDRKNLPEATFVVDKLKEIMIRNRQNGKKQSIGIITFNDSQKDAILDEIENRRRVDIEFDDLYSEAENTENNSLDDIPFVKNIENVQGDERNTIIFSVGYAKDVDGRLHARFGSLNQEGGENRLNVAITRAREEIIIVCSFNPNELRIGDSAHDGPKLLKEYLLYAKYISERNIQSAQTILSNVNADMARIDTKSEKGMLLFDTVFEELVYNKLRSLNYEVDSQVGYSGYKIDLAVVHPDNPKKYILAIECDGASFHSAKSVRERDVVRQEFLEKRGWIIERIWSRNWWRNSDKEIKRIQEQIEKLRNQEINMNELQVTMR
jgi:superfamily I DNA and/or RNA helicase/very-short-patch-repair endonuclease